MSQGKLTHISPLLIKCEIFEKLQRNSVHNLQISNTSVVLGTVESTVTSVTEAFKLQYY